MPCETRLGFLLFHSARNNKLTQKAVQARSFHLFFFSQMTYLQFKCLASWLKVDSQSNNHIQLEGWTGCLCLLLLLSAPVCHEISRMFCYKWSEFHRILLKMIKCLELPMTVTKTGDLNALPFDEWRYIMTLRMRFGGVPWDLLLKCKISQSKLGNNSLV